MCVAFLASKDQLGGALSPKAETAGVHQDVFQGGNVVNVLLGTKTLTPQFLGVQTLPRILSTVQDLKLSAVRECAQPL